jgi:hypothetical protein
VHYAGLLGIPSGGAGVRQPANKNKWLTWSLSIRAPDKQIPRRLATIILSSQEIGESDIPILVRGAQFYLHAAPIEGGLEFDRFVPGLERLTLGGAVAGLSELKDSDVARPLDDED